MHKRRNIIFNSFILLFVIIGTIIMLQSKESATGLTADGWENLRYYTVLSNEFAGIIAVFTLSLLITDKDGKLWGLISVLKLVGATGVGLTFMIIACFFGPLYGYLQLYKGSNFWFHLIVPVLCMTEFILLDTGKDEIKFRYTFIAAIPTVLYGMFYLLNILINGVGVWPDGNDWYGFVNWGMPVGIGIFAGIVIVSWIVAVALRQGHKLLYIVEEKFQTTRKKK